MEQSTLEVIKTEMGISASDKLRQRWDWNNFMDMEIDYLNEGMDL